VWAPLEEHGNTSKPLHPPYLGTPQRALPRLSPFFLPHTHSTPLLLTLSRTKSRVFLL
jgi:hypothetical protein